jgi:hypothetical protein
MDGRGPERVPRVGRRSAVIGGVKLAGIGTLALAQRGRGWALAQDAAPATGAALGYPD